jgi:ABC-2 type transport system ATP-binding protein
MMEKELVADRVGFRYGKRCILSDLSLDLTRGSLTVLLGANGVGKTTLMHLALGLLRPSEGTLRVFGLDPVRNPRPVRERIGFVPSEPDAPKWMTLRDLRAFLRPQYPRWSDSLLDELIARLRVPRTTPFRAMSRGEGMKTMLVAALACRPSLLLLDEPFAGLDPLARDEVLTGVVGSLRDEGTTVLCTTHDLEAAARIADRVAVLADGRIVREGPIADFIPADKSALDALRETVVAQIRQEQPCG